MIMESKSCCKLAAGVAIGPKICGARTYYRMAVTPDWLIWPKISGGANKIVVLSAEVPLPMRFCERL